MRVNKSDIIEKDYILLDWNVIKYIKEPRNSVDKEVKCLLKTIQKRYAIPFCEAHLRDLARSFSKENKNKVDEDLCFLQELSNGVIIGLDENDQFFLLKYSASDLFQEIVDEEPKSPNIMAEINPQSIFKVDMQKLDKDHPLRGMLEKTDGVYGPGIMANWLNKTFEPLFSEIDDYKKYREYIKKIKRDLNENTQLGLLPQDEVYKQKLLQHMMPLIDALEIEDEKALAIIWKDAIINWLQMRYNENVPFGELITTAYVMLDFHPLFREKLKKRKNTLSNITRDSKMIFYASKSRYFVTEDNSCYEKVKFVFHSLGVKTKVLKMADFVEIFS